MKQIKEEGLNYIPFFLLNKKYDQRASLRIYKKDGKFYISINNKQPNLNSPFPTGKEAIQHAVTGASKNGVSLYTDFQTHDYYSSSFIDSGNVTKKQPQKVSQESDNKIKNIKLNKLAKDVYEYHSKVDDSVFRVEHIGKGDWAIHRFDNGDTEDMSDENYASFNTTSLPKVEKIIISIENGDKFIKNKGKGPSRLKIKKPETVEPEPEAVEPEPEAVEPEPETVEPEPEVVEPEPEPEVKISKPGKKNVSTKLNNKLKGTDVDQFIERDGGNGYYPASMNKASQYFSDAGENAKVDIVKNEELSKNKNLIYDKSLPLLNRYPKYFRIVVNNKVLPYLWQKKSVAGSFLQAVLENAGVTPENKDSSFLKGTSKTVAESSDYIKKQKLNSLEAKEWISKVIDSLSIKSTGPLPKRKDFESQQDYLDALENYNEIKKRNEELRAGRREALENPQASKKYFYPTPYGFMAEVFDKYVGINNIDSLKKEKNLSVIKWLSKKIIRMFDEERLKRVGRLDLLPYKKKAEKVVNYIDSNISKIESERLEKERVKEANKAAKEKVEETKKKYESILKKAEKYKKDFAQIDKIEARMNEIEQNADKKTLNAIREIEDSDLDTKSLSNLLKQYVGNEEIKEFARLMKKYEDILRNKQLVDEAEANLSAGNKTNGELEDLLARQKEMEESGGADLYNSEEYKDVTRRIEELSDELETLGINNSLGIDEKNRRGEKDSVESDKDYETPEEFEKRLRSRDYGEYETNDEDDYSYDETNDVMRTTLSDLNTEVTGYNKLREKYLENTKKLREAYNKGKKYPLRSLMQDIGFMPVKAQQEYLKNGEILTKELYNELLDKKLEEFENEVKKLEKRKEDELINNYDVERDEEFKAEHERQNKMREEFVRNLYEKEGKLDEFNQKKKELPGSDTEEDFGKTWYGWVMKEFNKYNSKKSKEDFVQRYYENNDMEEVFDDNKETLTKNKWEDWIKSEYSQLKNIDVLERFVKRHYDRVKDQKDLNKFSENKNKMSRDQWESWLKSEEDRIKKIRMPSGEPDMEDLSMSQGEEREDDVVNDEEPIEVRSTDEYDGDTEQEEEDDLSTGIAGTRVANYDDVVVSKKRQAPQVSFDEEKMFTISDNDYVYDEDGNSIGHYDEGYIFDDNQRKIGHVDNGYIYDNNMNKIGAIDYGNILGQELAMKNAMKNINAYKNSIEKIKKKRLKNKVKSKAGR